MGRYLGAVCRLCRREGKKLYLKGSRCYSPKCALERRNYPPGMHTRRTKLSEYGLRLREKQKLKRFYGVSQRQFERIFDIASRSKENTGEMLLSLMERRLDNIVHRLGWAVSRRAARQIVAHGHIRVNGRRVDIPSYLVQVGDEITLRPSPKTLQMVKAALEQMSANQPPAFLEVSNGETPSARVVRLPTYDDVDPRLTREIEINPQLIIEFTTR
ncbi:MAG: 30S ribosomal protein S4 [Gemmatales bacterium]|nr:30S ribosomal protein S4 [Gemmatales bacterium]MDW7994161.1 30S ribosomal protein S4 [Gemmatales bacterium]